MAAGEVERDLRRGSAETLQRLEPLIEEATRLAAGRMPSEAPTAAFGSMVGCHL
jgi:hypothetical protein